MKQEPIKNNEANDGVAEKQEVIVRNKETLQFEEALKQWVN